jgi:hypothetical protein
MSGKHSNDQDGAVDDGLVFWWGCGIWVGALLLLLSLAFSL